MATPKTLQTANLVGATDLADRIDASPNTVNRWRQLHEDFPQPVLMVNHRTPVWNMPDVDEWLKKTGRTDEEARTSKK